MAAAAARFLPIEALPRRAADCARPSQARVSGSELTGSAGGKGNPVCMFWHDPGVIPQEERVGPCSPWKAAL